MLNRSNLVLIFILLIQVVFLAASVVISTGSEGRRVEQILRDQSVDEVDSITIADDLDAEVTLARGPDGWVLPAADDFPANGVKIEELLHKLVGLDTGRLIATNPANFARLEVADDDYRRKIIVNGDGKTAVVYLGGGTGVDTVYVRRGDENLVYLGSGMSAWDASTLPSGWIDSGYVGVPQADVFLLTVTNANGSFTFQRDGESWIYEGLAADESFDNSKMSSLLRNATLITMQKPLGLTPLDEYGVADPSVTVEVAYRQIVEPETDDANDEDADDPTDADIEIEYAEHSYTLTFGARQDDGDVVLKSSSEEYYVAVRESVLNAFDDIGHADLVLPVDTESEGAGESGE